MLRSKVLDSLLLFILRMFLVQLIVAVSSSPSEFLVFIWLSVHCEIIILAQEMKHILRMLGFCLG